ncbi:unnamed protein product [Moneuplotes crassus]|uniref:Uncharacterized protein n=1 Tax=Euplotes crassus TaxID=5936 RepID=A0AAD1U3W1_EUPCR|nr:unnamed protein product [Moneuplotes crassus]
MEFLGDPSMSDDDMNKDHLLIKCREVIESLNSEIEEERIAFKIVKEENERLKSVDSELYKYKTEYEDVVKRLEELEEYCEENKAQTQAFFEKVNLDFTRKLDPYLCTCHELKAEGLSPEYKCVYCLANKQIKVVKNELNQKFKLETEKMQDSFQAHLKEKDTKIEDQSLQIKSLSKDFSKLKKESEEDKSNNENLSLKVAELESELEKSKMKNNELEDKIKHFSVEVAMDHSSKVQELESQIEKEKMTYHETKIEIAELEEKIQGLKHENLLLTSKVEEMNFNDIELNEKIKKLQQDYENQMDDLSASKQELRNKWKEKYKHVGKELDISNQKIHELQEQVEEQERIITEKQKEVDTIQYMEADLSNSHEQIEALKHNISELEKQLKDKSKLVHHQKSMINKLASEKDDFALELEKQQKLFEVSINEKNSKIEHLKVMIEKYKKVVDKADEKLKQLPQEFALEMMTVKKKLKRDKEAQEEIRKLKRELLEKELEWKRQISNFKSQEVKAPLTEWDMNSFNSNAQDIIFRKMNLKK